MDPDAVAVVRARCLGLPQAEVDSTRAAEVDDALATLADDCGCSRVTEWLEQSTVKREASIELRDDQIEVIDARLSHRPTLRHGTGDRGDLNRLRVASSRRAIARSLVSGAG